MFDMMLLDAGTSALRQLFADIAEGQYAAALRSDTSVAILGGFGSRLEQTTGVASYFESVPAAVQAALDGGARLSCFRSPTLAGHVT